VHHEQCVMHVDCSEVAHIMSSSGLPGRCWASGTSVPDSIMLTWTSNACTTESHSVVARQNMHTLPVLRGVSATAALHCE